MNGEINRLDDLFREGMDGQQEMPSPAVWKRIEEELDKKEKRRPFLFFFSSYKKAAAVLFIGIISASLMAGGYLLIHSHSSNKIEQTEEILSKKEKSEKKSSPTQPKETTTHHIPVNTDKKILNVNTVSEKLADNSKDQLIKKSPSNEAVANQPYVHESVPFKNKTEVAGRKTITKPVGVIDNNASAVSATEEQTNMASIAIVQRHRQNFASFDESVVSNKQPISVKTPSALSAPATPVSPTQPLVSEKKKKKEIYFSVTPIALRQQGVIRIDNNLPRVLLPPGIPTPPSIPGPITTLEATNYTANVGLQTALHLNKFSIQTGFNLSSQYFKLSDQLAEVVQRPDGKAKYWLNSSFGSVFIDPKYGNRPTVGNVELISDIKTTFTYLQVPLLVNYHMGKGRLQAYVTAGGNINVLAGLSVTGNILDLKEKHKIEDKETFINPTFFHIVVGGGIKWKMTKTLSFMLSPQYQYAVTPSIEIPFIKSFPNNLTIQTGIQISLRK